MNLSVFIAKRLSTGKSAGSSPLIIRIAVIGVALSVAVMIIALAIVKGYQQEIKNKITGFSTHIQISKLDLNNSYETVPIFKDSTLETSLPKMKGVIGFQRYAIKPGIIKTEKEFQGVVLKGIDNSYNWTFLKQYLVEGDTLKFDSTVSQKIVISSKVAAALHLKLGDGVTMFFVQDPPRARRFKITGIYNTGFDELDKLFVFADLRQVQKLNNWDTSAISGYEVIVDDFKNADLYAADMLGIVPYFMKVITTKELHPELFDWLSLLDLNVIVILILMAVVACINMLTALLILIVERSNMIGILKALGMKNRSISRVFLIMSCYLILIGLALGNTIGLALCYSQQKFGWFKLAEEAYFVSEVPIRFDTMDIVWINVASALVCYLVLLLPSRFVSRVAPVKAIRFE